MCAYNAIDDYPACANKMLLQTILRGDWNFQGFVTSDCGAVDDFFEAKAHHTSPDKDSAAVAGIEAGTDTNCGRTYLALTDAVKKGLITEAQIDVSLKRLFLARYRLGLFDPPTRCSTPSPLLRGQLARAPGARPQAARESMVLLKNSNNTLPLAPARSKPSPSSAPTPPSSPPSKATTTPSPKIPSFPSTASSNSSPHAKVLYAQGSPYAENASIVIPRTQFRTARRLQRRRPQGRILQ